MKLKTKFWDEKDKKIWTKRYVKLVWFMAVFSLSNILFGVLNEMYVLLFMNCVPLLVFLLAISSNNKWEREKWYQEREKNKVSLEN